MTQCRKQNSLCNCRGAHSSCACGRHRRLVVNLHRESVHVSNMRSYAKAKLLRTTPAHDWCNASCSMSLFDTSWNSTTQTRQLLSCWLGRSCFWSIASRIYHTGNTFWCRMCAKDVIDYLSYRCVFLFWYACVLGSLCACVDAVLYCVMHEKMEAENENEKERDTEAPFFVAGRYPPGLWIPAQTERRIYAQIQCGPGPPATAIHGCKLSQESLEPEFSIFYLVNWISNTSFKYVLYGYCCMVAI